MAKDTNELRKVQGQGIMVKDFLDGKERKAVPVKMAKFADFMDSISSIAIDELWVNFIGVDRRVALQAVFEMSFPDHKFEEISEQIDAGNFPAIVSELLKINGIKFGNKEEVDPNVGKV